MKSSGPLFTKQNPFQPASRVGKAHYHPSCNQPLLRKKKKTTLSPVRSNQRSSPGIHTLGRGSPQPPGKSDRCCAGTVGQPVFSESWPSTDCASSAASPAASPDTEATKQSARVGKSAVSSALGMQQDSVLAKYVERFRHGRPQSREERRQMASATIEEELWWMSPPSLPPSSTPIKTAHKDQVRPLRDDAVPATFTPAGQRRHDRSPSPCRGSLSILSDTSQGEFEETEILHLQERAGRLLLRGECTLSDGSVPVSPEGLECSDFSSPVSVDEPVRRPLIPSLIKYTTEKAGSHSVPAVSSQMFVMPPSGPPTRPEEDILFQWRLRRKMEQAREQPPTLQHSSLHSPTFSWQAPSVSHPSAGGQAYKQTLGLSLENTHPHMAAPQPEANRPSPPASGPPPCPAFAVSQPQTIAHVPAHMHFLCDVLPCPIQSSHAGAQQNVNKRLNDAQTKVVSKKTQVPHNSADVVTYEPASEPVLSSKRTSPGAKEEEWPLHNKRCETKKKEKAETKESERQSSVPVRKQKKSTRYSEEGEHTRGPSSAKRSSSHQRPPKKVTPLAELQHHEESQEFSSEGRTDRRTPPPPSPVHSALGQVVSEVLFPPVDSSPAQWSPAPLVRPPRAAPAPPQSAAPPCNTQHSVEVISQLLQDAEDSDEKEFEDDPLLQVLRKQRTWVKEQISEVDSILNEFLHEQRDT